MVIGDSWCHPQGTIRRWNLRWIRASWRIMFVVCLIDTPPRTFIWKQPLIDYPQLFPISSFEISAGLILPYKRQSSFKGISVDYGLKSVCGSERIPLKLSGRKYDLTNYQWKSSVFGYVPIDLGSVNLLNLLDRRGLWPRTSSCNRVFTGFIKNTRFHIKIN